MEVFLRGGKYYVRVYRPRRFAPIEKRARVWVSLQTDSLKEAQRRAIRAADQQLAIWEAAAAGDDPEQAFKAAKLFTEQVGLRYLPSSRVAELPVADIVARLDAAAAPGGGLDLPKARAVLGVIQKPKLTLSGALEEYWRLTEDKFVGYSENQIRLAKNPRKKAFANLIKVVGDIELEAFTKDELLEFREWWWDTKIKGAGVQPASANKDFNYLSSTLTHVATARRITLNVDFERMAFAAGEKRTRAPFSEEWIRTRLLAPRALDGLNLEARCILLGMINTGYRPSEAQGLLPHHIRLDTNIPHICIEPEGRKLKTGDSRRVIPLAGVSLDAFRLCPDGFPRYRDTATLSATVNKYLRENKLLQSEAHTLYGLRHSFEDRLLDRDVDERIRRDLMGHSLGGRQRYGEGASLEKAHRAIQAIAI